MVKKVDFSTIFIYNYCKKRVKVVFFEQENISFQILDVLYIKQGSIKTDNYGRNFEAISLRYKAGSVVEYNGKTIEFGDNTIGFFPANLDYKRTSKGDTMIAIHFKTFNYRTKDVEKFVPTDYGKYRILFEEALRIWNEKAVSYMHETASVVNRIFAQLYADNKKTNTHQRKIYNSVEYIDSNCLDKDFKLSLAAEKSFMSETHFRRLFKEEFGISPKQYIINLRIKKATSLIIAGYHTLKDISAMCGYDDYKHFSVEFKKKTGISPSKYRYTKKELFLN